jgi:predicted acyltransferase (DUF342 family)
MSLPAFFRFLLPLSIAACMPAHAAEEGTAQGQISVSGKVVKFAHAYAREVTSEDRTRYALVIVSDTPISAEDVKTFPDSVIKDVKAGKLHAMSLLISADGTTVKSSDLWDADFEYGAERTINEDNAIELKSIAIGHIAAHAHLLKEHKYIDNEKFEYDVIFDTPIVAE